MKYPIMIVVLIIITAYSCQEADCYSQEVKDNAPENCPNFCDEVCGCDEITYCNTCFANNEGITVISNELCD
jgi:hypothetical protein